MRHTSPQLPLTAPWIAHAHATELAAMSGLLDEQPVLTELVQQDLEASCPQHAQTGRSGLNIPHGSARGSNGRVARPFACPLPSRSRHSRSIRAVSRSDMRHRPTSTTFEGL